MSSTASPTASTVTSSTLSKRAELLLKIAMVISGPQLLLLFPLEFQVLDESYSTVPQEVLTAKAIEANIPVVDLLPAYRQACQEKPGGACHLEDRYLFTDVWMHPSAYGHELIAIKIKAFLDELLE